MERTLEVNSTAFLVMRAAAAALRASAGAVVNVSSVPGSSRSRVGATASKAGLVMLTGRSLDGAGGPRQRVCGLGAAPMADAEMDEPAVPRV